MAPIQNHNKNNNKIINNNKVIHNTFYPFYYKENKSELMTNVKLLKRRRIK